MDLAVFTELLGRGMRDEFDMILRSVELSENHMILYIRGIISFRIN